MKKSFLILLAAALIIPAFAVAAPGFHYPGHGNSGFNHPGNGGGVAVYPGNNNNNHYNHNNYGYNNHGYNNNNNGYGNNNNNNNNSNHYNSGYNNHSQNHGHPGHYSPANAKIRMAHRSIKRAFQSADNAYFPFFMNHKDKRRMGMAMRQISFEIGGLMRLVGHRFRDNLREVGMLVEKAKFALASENDSKRAHRILQRAERKYNRIADILIK